MIFQVNDTEGASFSLTLSFFCVCTPWRARCNPSAVFPLLFCCSLQSYSWFQFEEVYIGTYAGLRALNDCWPLPTCILFSLGWAHRLLAGYVTPRHYGYVRETWICTRGSLFNGWSSGILQQGLWSTRAYVRRLRCLCAVAIDCYIILLQQGFLCFPFLLLKMFELFRPNMSNRMSCSRALYLW